ncbi:hypothetical protein JCM1841_001916 [Sporobolomyces salmonicolor]
MRPTAAAVLVASWSALPAWATFDCKGLSVDGSSYDLSKLGGVHTFEVSTPTPPTVTKTQYQLSLCSPLPEHSGSPDDACPSGTRICMSTYSTRPGLEDRLLSVVPIAGDINGTDGQAKAIQIEGVKVDEAWLLEMSGGQYNGVDQRARIEMRCDQSATETVPTVKDYDSKSGVLELKWVTSAACPTSAGGNDPPPPSKPDEDEPPTDDEREPPSSGMGFLGWFFTLLFLGLIAYFAFGSYNNYTTYGATGWDMIPHRDVWRDLPYVVMDLFKGRGGGSRSGYSALG